MYSRSATRRSTRPGETRSTCTIALRDVVCSREQEVAMTHAFVKSIHGIRYQVKDVARAVAFYTERLGFTLQHQQLPAFANVALGDASILLSGPGASGSR